MLTAELPAGDSHRHAGVHESRLERTRLALSERRARQCVWVLQASGKTFSVKLLEVPKTRGMVKPQTLTPVQAYGMDYYQLTDVAGGVQQVGGQSDRHSLW